MKNNKGRGAVSDGHDTNRYQQPERKLTNNAKILVIYFSRGGNTEQQAQFAQQYLGADLYELVVQHPYPANYSASVNRATQERESRNWPALDIQDFPNLMQYDLILLGHPIWAMTIANPMRSFLEQDGDRLSDKRVASFSTNAGYGSGETQRILSDLLPASTRILENYSIEDVDLDRDRPRFTRWLNQVNLRK
ncbi:flavodoxin family protein [Secundilactobacillus similis]|uniref:flavodoxin family protein n=1 Tax=Secundilactobacillus similis TaxID=414682 RepID=UPI0006D0AA6B|nr:flavodoxin [Secundilactobacillus similis]